MKTYTLTPKPQTLQPQWVARIRPTIRLAPRQHRGSTRDGRAGSRMVSSNSCQVVIRCFPRCSKNDTTQIHPDPMIARANILWLPLPAGKDHQSRTEEDQPARRMDRGSILARRAHPVRGRVVGPISSTWLCCVCGTKTQI